MSWKRTLTAVVALAWTQALAQTQEQEPRTMEQPPTGTQEQPMGGEMQGQLPEQLQAEEAALPPDWSRTSRLLTQARTEVTRDPKRAARHIHDAARILDRHGREIRGQPGADLRAAAQNLNTVAEDLRRQEQVDATMLDQPYAQAFTAMASYHQARAQEHWERRATQDAGESLRAAAFFLERAAMAAGRGGEETVRVTVRETRRVAGDLMEGVGVVPREVGQAISAVGREVENLGRAVKPRGRAGRRPPPTE